MELLCIDCLEAVGRDESKDLWDAYSVIDGKALCLVHLSEYAGWSGAENWKIIDRLRKQRKDF